MNPANWIGKIVGGLLGLVLSKGSILAMMIGALLGHQFDRGFRRDGPGGPGGAKGFSGAGAAERQAVFFETLFLTMGHLAKVDGRVSEQEIQVARSIMHHWRLRPEEVKRAIELFSRGKRADFPLEAQLNRFKQAVRGQPEILRTFLEVLMEMPLAKGKISSVERNLLWRVAASLGVGRVEMAQLEALLMAQRSFGQGGAAGGRPSRANELEQAYKALGITADVSDKEVKTAYRRLINQHHPDKLVSRGLPESMMEVAEERTREIRSAYEKIRDQRGMK